MDSLLGGYGSVSDESDSGDDIPQVKVPESSATPIDTPAETDNDTNHGSNTGKQPPQSPAASDSGLPASGSTPQTPSETPGQTPHPGASEIPNSSDVDPNLIDRIRTLHRALRKGDRLEDHFHATNRDYHNPYLLQKLVSVFELDEYRSMYPQHVFDPHTVAAHQYDYYDAKRHPEAEALAEGLRAKLDMANGNSAPPTPPGSAPPTPPGGNSPA